MSSVFPVPAKHRQVFEIMRSRIQSGDYQPGDRIPSEAHLIQEFGVSRPTVARALQELQAPRLGKATPRGGHLCVAGRVDAASFSASDSRLGSDGSIRTDLC